MVLAWAAILGAALLGLPVQAVAVGAILGFLLLELGTASRITRVHLAAGGILAAAVLLISETAGSDLLAAAFRASFIMVLFASLGMLQTAVMRIKAFIEAGEMLVRQPPGRQYFALAGGTTLFGAVLNFGVLPLMGGLVKAARSQGPDQSPGEASPDAGHALRERRIMLAMLRGFSVLMFWCPLTVAYAITTTTIEGLDWRIMALAGAVLAALVIWLGSFFDKAPSRPAAARADTRFDWAALGPILALLVLLSLLAASVDAATPGGLVHGVILFVPLTALALLAWFEPKRARARVTQYLGSDVATQRNEVAVLGNAAFSGALIAALLPQDALLTGPGALLPIVLLPALCLWLVVLLGQTGINPLISVAALSAILSDPAPLGLNPTLLGLALVTGWGLTVGSSSAAAATMSVGRLTDRTAWQVGTIWNGRFTLIASMVAGAAITALSLALA